MPQEKRRKRNDGSSYQLNQNLATPENPKLDQHINLNTAKPSAIFQPIDGGRKWTLSVALPGSIIKNAQSHDAKTFLAGNIARALAVFCVDEVVIFDDGREGEEAKNALHPQSSAQLSATPLSSPAQTGDRRPPPYTAFSHPRHFLLQLLSFLETPAHLRKALFPTHPNLRTAGSLPSLDMPHHLRADEWCPYREGVSLNSTEDGTYVDVGLGEPRFVPGVTIPDNSRVTLKLSQESTVAEAVDPAEPRELAGYYWGYTVRESHSLSAVLTECPFDGGYDLSVGTSERGIPLDDISNTDIPKFNHLLIVLGGVAGLETAVSHDEELRTMGIDKRNVGDLFDYWVNVLPGQGSRTIRTEEAIWLALMGTRRFLQNR